MGAWVFSDEHSGADVSRDDMRATAVSGSGLIRDVAARIELDGGAPLWVAGQNRAWLAEAIEGAVGLAKFPHPFGDEYVQRYLEAGMTIPTWEGLANFLRERADAPAVVTYSVSDDFPSAAFAPDNWRQDLVGEDRWDAFDDLPSSERWVLCMPGLIEARPDAELAPDNAFMAPVIAADAARAAEERAYLDAIYPTLSTAELERIAELPAGSHPMIVIASAIPAHANVPAEQARLLGYGSRTRQEIRPEAADWRDMLRWIERSMRGSMMGARSRLHAFECSGENFGATIRMLVAHDPACVVAVSGVARLAEARRLCPELAGRPIMSSFTWLGLNLRGPAEHPVPADECLADIRPMSDDELLAYAGEYDAEFYLECLRERRERITGEQR
jgi:hypothetical protein